MASSNSPLGFQPHVVIFPFLAQGHIIPLLDLSKAFSSRGVQVTIITTPLNAPFIALKTSRHSLISLAIITFPKVEGLPEGCENFANIASPSLYGLFFKALSLFKQPFEDILRNMSKTPIAVISDMFIGWTLDSCNLFNIPRISFDGMGVFSSFIFKYSFLNSSSLLSLADSTPFQFSNLSAPFAVTKADLPPEFAFFTDSENPTGKMIINNILADKNSWGLISNSFEEIEGAYVPALESLHQEGTKVWCVGPTLLSDNSKDDDEKKQSCPYIDWLNRQQGLVIYVSFGSQTKLSNLELDEIAQGLEMAGQNFIWVVKSESWAPPEGWTEGISGKGMVVRDWLDQRRILSHPATGGFLSHSGWNSVMEGLSAGVPLLAWPINADQKINAKYVVNGLGMGVLSSEEKPGSINRGAISSGVKRLMVGEEGKKARERAQELGAIARKCVEKNGSSYEKLGELIECLVEKKKIEKLTQI